MRARPATSVAILALASAACFAGYDSRWGEAKRAKQRAAAESAPSAITAAADDGGAASAAGQRTFRVRVHTTDHFLSQTIDAPKQIASLVDDANAVLQPTFKLRLEVDRIQPWSRDADDDLDASLAALRQEDGADGADLVVGMLGALPRQSDSFHEVGMAPILGKHLVVRAASRLGEHDAIDQAFSELSEEDRARLLARKRRHRAEAVFLHELGHTLGAIHENDVRSVMHSAYDSKMAGFGGGAVALMRIALDGTDPKTVARAQLDLLRGATSSDWVARDRDDEIARLTAVVGPPPAAGVAGSAGSATASAPQDPTTPPELHGDDLERYRNALSWIHYSRVAQAYQTAKPLFTAYPDALAVQDLRCQLAALRYLDKDTLKAECASYVRLSNAADARGR